MTWCRHLWKHHHHWLSFYLPASRQIEYNTSPWNLRTLYKNQAGKQLSDVIHFTFPHLQTILLLFMCSCTSPNIPSPAFDVYALRRVFFLYWNPILKHIIHTGLWFSEEGKSTAKRRNPLKIGSSQSCIHNTQHTGKTTPPHILSLFLPQPP